MTILRYLLERTLTVVCNDNKSECAKRLGLSYDDLRRVRKRLDEGAGSQLLTEAVFEMYYREHLSLDAVMEEYAKHLESSDDDDGEAFCKKLIVSMTASMDIEEQEAEINMRLIKSARSFFRQMEHFQCNKQCKERRKCGGDCPCKRFSEFWEWFKNQHDSHQ